MSLHEFLNPNTGAFTYGNIACNNLNCLTINGLNPSGGGGGGGSGSGIFAQLGYVNHSTQSFGANANEIITWSTPDAENNFGSSAIQLVGGNTFANKSSNNVSIIVNGFVSFQFPVGSAGIYSVALFVAKNGNLNDRYSVQEVSSDNDFVNLSFNFNAVLSPNDDFCVYAWTNSTNGMIANAIDFPGSRIVIGEFAEGSASSSPTLASVLASGNDGNGQYITNVQAVNANYEITAGNSSASAGILTSMNKINQYQIIADSGTSCLQFQQYSTENPALINQPLTLNPDGSVLASSNGVLQVTNGTLTGRVYDDTIYRPMGGGGSNVSFLAYSATTAQPVAPSELQPVFWNIVPVNTYGVVGLTVTPSTGQFFNNTNTQMLLLVDGYITWDLSTNPQVQRDVSILKNGNEGQALGYSQYSGSYITAFSASVLLNAGDFFAVNVYQTDSKNDNISNGSANASRVNIVRLV